ncbi:LINE-1 reverse transcriptase [Aphis craccivora]|uniref:LINE-1 reverse transcriptase n=1 Tax=Aphis craccivora TaxID=307492 RepID=A0A6G0YER1_APHCR|nr:LINE-1 reverse transcriptase [Aphis craccivora]
MFYILSVEIFNGYQSAREYIPNSSDYWMCISPGVIPEDWIKSEFIALPKISSAKTCGDYRTISLMNHLLKMQREDQIAPNQFGFLNSLELILFYEVRK